MLTLTPINLKTANAFVQQYHRQQTIQKMQQLNEQQFKGLELEWYKSEEPNKKTGVAEK